MDYQKEALRTEAPAPNYAPVKILRLLKTLEYEAYRLGDALDIVKREIFYGKGVTDETVLVYGHVLNKSGINEATYLENPRLLHAALGIMTEACEFFEAVNRDKGEVNFAEELGDLLWYIALAMSVLGLSEDAVKRANIAKLRARFPDRFTQERALERDLAEERREVQEKLS